MMKFQDCLQHLFYMHRRSLHIHVITNDIYIEASLGKCPNNQCNFKLYENSAAIANKVTSEMRQKIKSYYQGWLKCEDSACNARVQKLPLMFQRGRPMCPVCNRGFLQLEYTDNMLYTQMCFYQYLFDLDRASQQLAGKEKEKMLEVKKDPELCNAYITLKRLVDRWLRKNAYSEVNLDKLFEGLFTLK